MSLRSDTVPLFVLGAGFLMLSLASRRKPRVVEDHVGEGCVQDEEAPDGYRCADGSLKKDQEHFTGYGPYMSESAMYEALSSLGFEWGDVAGFQSYVNRRYGFELREDGAIDRDSTRAIRDAEEMKSRNEWEEPRAA